MAWIHIGLYLIYFILNVIQLMCAEAVQMLRLFTERGDRGETRVCT